jgi:hypothetical protein
MTLDERAYQSALQAFWGVFWGGMAIPLEQKINKGVGKAIKAYIAEIERRVTE